ncbi:hypothetical protein [Flavobacterium sp.]|uniref:DUF7222 domain-containing protein n=1 Tax=Flavobacterium sp. TaxID=239 RepID=UPI002608A970|nr:hypothetical protein [Flavobacterium sp.]MDD2987133.1 hypothetical protein [Flavobacterium sp.]
MNTTTLIKKLTAIANNPASSLEKEVALEALTYPDPQEFFTLLSEHGCVSGLVGSLIYYTQTHAFYDTHYQEIEELREEFEKNTGTALRIY